METLLEGLATSVEIMPNTAWFPEAVKMLREHPGIDIGVHLTLSSEWENVRWRPLTSCPSLTDEQGYFPVSIYPDKEYPGQSISEMNWKPEEIEQEFRAQIERVLQQLPQATHISNHMGACNFDKEVAALTARLAREYGLADITTRPLEEYGIQGIWFDGPHTTLAEKKESLIRALNRLEKGKTYMFLEHPAYDDEEMRAVYKKGYMDVAADRQGVTDLLLSKELREAIEEKGIQVVSYGEVIARQTTSSR